MAIAIVMPPHGVITGCNLVYSNWKSEFLIVTESCTCSGLRQIGAFVIKTGWRPAEYGIEAIVCTWLGWTKTTRNARVPHNAQTCCAYAVEAIILCTWSLGWRNTRRNERVPHNAQACCACSRRNWCVHMIGMKNHKMRRIRNALLEFPNPRPSNLRIPVLRFSESPISEVFASSNLQFPANTVHTESISIAKTHRKHVIGEMYKKCLGRRPTSFTEPSETTKLNPEIV